MRVGDFFGTFFFANVEFVLQLELFVFIFFYLKIFCENFIFARTREVIKKEEKNNVFVDDSQETKHKFKRKKCLNF